MTRDLQALAEREFDLLIVGAGIYGATMAWEATQRGLSVALIDRGDFGGGTSFNSLKTIHGGLRSLQRANLTEMRQFIAERRTLMRIAPHLVRPLRFLIPTYPRPRRSRVTMRLVLAINDRIARNRNDGVDPALRLPDSAVVGKDETLRLFPGLAPARLTGGASWYDGQMHHADRVLLAFVQSAVARGAVAANYVGAVGFLRAGDRIHGVSARDQLTGATIDIRARLTLNAAGGWAGALSATASGAAAASVGVRMSRAVNLVTRLPAPACALGDTADGQFLFQVPWRGVTMFGTFHDTHAAEADTLTVRAADVDRFLSLINRAFPAVRARPDAVTLVHRGLLPAAGVGRGGEVRLLKESLVHDHRAEGLPGLMTVVGVRYTTARRTAERAVDAVGIALGRALRPSETASTPLAGGDIEDLEAFFERASREAASGSEATARRLASAYGTAYPCVLEVVASRPDLAHPLGDAGSISGAEVVYSVRKEMALKLADVLMRRTDAGSAACPSRAVLDRAAALMAAELGWDRSRIAAEIEEVEARYRIPS